MAKSEIVKKLEDLEKERDIDVSDIISEVEELFEDNEELEDNVKRLKDEIEDLEEKVEELEGVVLESESKDNFEFENQTHNNLRTQSALEDLFKNIDYIPIDKLEEFINQHKQL